MLLFRWIHLVGLALFLGCGLAAGILNRLAHDDAQIGPLDRAQREVGRLADAGTLLLFLSGGLLLWLEGFTMQTFGKAGWVQIMLTLGLVGAAVNGIAGGKLRRALATPPGDPRALRGTLFTLRLIFLLSAMGAVVCGVWRFYW